MYRNWTLLIVVALAVLPRASATPTIGVPVTIAQGSGATYQAITTTQITTGPGDPALIAGGVNLLRVDGATPVAMGVLHDDGLNGDATAGDGIYTLAYNATTASLAQMHLQVSAAFRGTLRRLKSGVGTVQIVTPSITQVLPATGRQGQQGLMVTIAGQYSHFAQGTTVASFGAGVTVASLIVNSATSAIAMLNLAAAAPIGVNDVTVTTGSEALLLAGGFTVASATLPGDAVTWHYDGSRSGLNPHESQLTPATVNSTGFGKIAEFTVDGQIDSQILFLNQLDIPNVGTRDVVFAATENDTVYALDAASMTGSAATVLWHTSVLPPGETAAPLSGLPCGNILQNGITATPVIDRARNAIYVVAMSQNSQGQTFQRFHALSLTTGAELFGGPVNITATFPGSGGYSQNGVVTFNPAYHHDRAALLLTGNTIYTVWSGMYGDCGFYSPWVIAYNADTLAQTAVLDLAPENYGGGMWMGGAGPAVDAAGNVYVITGNGFGGLATYSNSFIKLSTNGGLVVGDYFTPDNTVAENNADLDFGSAGPLLLPDLADGQQVIRHLAVGAGKDGQMYVVDRDNLGQYNTAVNRVGQQIPLSGTLNFSTPVYFHNTVYLSPSGATLKAFPVTQALLAVQPSMHSTHSFSGGAVISISSNGDSNGIIWALDYAARIFYAFDAANIATEIYNSSQVASRDRFSGVTGHFNTPMVANGRVYFGTGVSVVVFGLLP